MRRFVFLLLMGLSALLRAEVATDSVTAVVRDADTGEPIPYVSVYVSPTCGTISNYDGEFSLQCLPSDVLRITSIGYQRVTCLASELPATVRMKPITTTLRELTVTGPNNILYRLVRKLQKEAGKNKKAVADYFFRMTTQYPGTDELAEVFLTAKSCVQMRDIVFHSGNRGLLKEDGILDAPDLKGLGRTNVHVFLRLAPVLAFYDWWDFAIVPADIVLSRRGKLYDATCTTFIDDDGREIVKVHLTGKPASNSYTILEGTLYVDSKRCEMLRFDGQMKGLYVRMYDSARRRASVDTVGYTMHVDYTRQHGFTEIANMSGTIVKDKVRLRYLLFNLGEKEMTYSRAVPVGENMLKAIDKVGYDSTLWAMTGIVKRTRMEERIAFGDSTFFRTDKSRYDVPPSAQEQGANDYLRKAIGRLKAGAMQLHRGLPSK